MSYTLICDHSMDTRNCREGYVDAMYELVAVALHIDPALVDYMDSDGALCR